jgi:hypothetical protein
MRVACPIHLILIPIRYIAAGLRQHSHFLFRAQRESWSHFTLLRVWKSCSTLCPLIFLDLTILFIFWIREQVMKLLSAQSTPTSYGFIQISFSVPCSQIPALYAVPLVPLIVFHAYTQLSPKLCFNLCGSRLQKRRQKILKHCPRFICSYSLMSQILIWYCVPQVV